MRRDGARLPVSDKFETRKIDYAHIIINSITSAHAMKCTGITALTRSVNEPVVK